jgi:hypothetical protein
MAFKDLSELLSGNPHNQESLDAGLPRALLRQSELIKEGQALRMAGDISGWRRKQRESDVYMRGVTRYDLWQKAHTEAPRYEEERAKWNQEKRRKKYAATPSLDSGSSPKDS